MIIHIHIYSLGFISFLFIFLHIIFFFFSLFFFFCFFFFFSSRRRHTRWPRDWSSDVCLPISNFARKKFTGDGSIAGEEARAEKGDERAKKQEQDRASDNGVQRNENRSDEQVGEVGFAKIGRASCRKECR